MCVQSNFLNVSTDFEELSTTVGFCLTTNQVSFRSRCVLGRLKVSAVKPLSMLEWDAILNTVKNSTWELFATGCPLIMESRGI